MSEINSTIGRLKYLLAEYQNVLLAYLFGSRARKESGPLSDWDLAILLQKEDISMESDILTKVARIIGVNEDSVNLVNLDRCI